MPKTAVLEVGGSCSFAPESFSVQWHLQGTPSVMKSRHKFSGKMDEFAFTSVGSSSKKIERKHSGNFSVKKRRSVGPLGSQSSFKSIPLVTSQSTFNLSTRKFPNAVRENSADDGTSLLNRKNFRSSYVNLSQLLQQKKLKDALRSVASKASI